jgi:predicted TIM-barrel fold metal-dependent hydrolase
MNSDNKRDELGHPTGSRREVLGWAAAASLAALTGCASRWPTPDGTPASNPGMLQPVVRKSAEAPSLCIDVHAHFFNASDVPVRGFLEGPIAFEKGGLIGDLIRALGPYAQALASAAPSAQEELDSLQQTARSRAFTAAPERATFLSSQVRTQREAASARFYELVRGGDFEQIYNRIVDDRARQQPPSLRELQSNDRLSPRSLENALQERQQRHAYARLQSQALTGQAYPEGVLAFVGVMLSPRWMNLYEYGLAFSAEADAFGIDHVFGALVDFEFFLEPTPRSDQVSQIALHQLLSELSGGYMRPLVGYNPWRDLQDNGQTTQRIVKAVKEQGFVGVKIYPPNGFRPFGNVASTAPGAASRGWPVPAQLDRVLDNFWNACIDARIPVMAHAGHSMGASTALDDLAGPLGWEAVIRRAGNVSPPFVNLGHFGGASDRETWTADFSRLMADPRGANVFADIAYWSELQCDDVGQDRCEAAKSRLRAALSMPAVAQRVMYGSDWHMLVQERNWWRYPFDIAEQTRSLPIAQPDLFANNALRCFAGPFSAHH